MSEQWVEAICSGVSRKELTAKATGRKFWLYTVETSMGQFTTAKRELAEEAHNSVGKPGRFLVKTEKRGEFTNYYLENVDVGAPGIQTAPAPTFQPPGPSIPAPSSVIAETAPDDKDERIHRQVAAKVSARLSSTSEEFWANLADLVAYFKDGSTPNRVAPATQTPDMSGGASTSFFDNTPNIPNTDDDIPF